MSYSLRLRPELVEDAHDAFVWYETAATGLGHEMLRCFFAAAACAHREPLLFRKVYGEFRRVLLDRFPYALYFRFEQETVIFFLLTHGARNPALIRRTLRQRKKQPAG